ncbi:hypothetical protein ACFCXH_16700 [Streptomyces nojiriensis]|uniref:hypothetical protein n=1 Tax=Streptomyces nojiriensis TaxID=66374 RepID=UPI0035DD3D88
MGEGREVDEGGRDGRRRRRAMAAGAVAALVGAAGVVTLGVKAGLPWWVLVAAAAVTAGLAGWSGARIALREDARDAILEPGENVVGTYTVRPPFTEHTPPSPHEGPRYQLRVTSCGMQMWERSVLLWRHPWPELRVMTDGPRLRVHHQGQEAGTMLLEPPGAVQEVRLVASRYGAG